MIEGCRLWPWVNAAAHKNELAIADCETCMERNSPQIRRHMTCGYEPRLDGEYRGWHPPDGKHGFRQNKKAELLPTVCPGYTTKLPIVFEIVRAHRHWRQGELRSFTPEPNDGLLLGIEILDSDVSAAHNHEMTPENGGK